jgi:hypothetical protein
MRYLIYNDFNILQTSMLTLSPILHFQNFMVQSFECAIIYSFSGWQNLHTKINMMCSCPHRYKFSFLYDKRKKRNLNWDRFMLLNEDGDETDICWDLLMSRIWFNLIALAWLESATHKMLLCHDNHSWKYCDKANNFH